VVYNAVLGGWYVVRGEHQTPISGRFDSRAEAKASLVRNEDGLTFAQWLHRVDMGLLRVWGVTTRDIADRCYRDAYNDEISPREMISEIMAEGIDAL